MKVLVVDDELPVLDELRFLLEREDDVATVKVAADATEALRHLRDTSFDAVFLDVSMPGLDGLELARVLAQFAEPPQVVFVTAHEQHAVAAFELRAVDYLLKPVRPERLGEALARLRVGLHVPRVNAPLVDAAAPLPENDDADVAPLRDGDDEWAVIECDSAGRTRYVRRDDVRYVEASGDYARLHVAAGSHLVRMSMAQLETHWAAAGFVRVHRSFLVPLAHVAELRADGSGATVMVLYDGRTLPVSRRLVREVKDHMRRAARDRTR